MLQTGCIGCCFLRISCSFKYSTAFLNACFIQCQSDHLSSLVLLSVQSVSYVWLFDYDTSDWSMSFGITSVLASTLWLICSLIHMGGMSCFKTIYLVMHYYFEIRYSLKTHTLSLLSGCQPSFTFLKRYCMIPHYTVNGRGVLVAFKLFLLMIRNPFPSPQISLVLLAAEVVGFDEITVRPPNLRRLSSNGSLADI